METLEGIRRCSWLEGAAAYPREPFGGNDFCHCVELLGALEAICARAARLRETKDLKIVAARELAAPESEN